MKLTIITINLNNREGLEKTIQSVLEQTFTDFEYLVIDGGSTDGSIEAIKQNADKISYWVSEPDKGIYNAMNKGIIKAKGEYCYFLNSGDFFASPDVLKNIFEGNPSESFICGNFITEKKGVQIRNTPYKDRDWGFSLYDIFSGFLAHQAFFTKKEMFDKYGLYDERLRVMSDWKLFIIAMGIHNEKVIYKNVDIAFYDTTGISSTIGGNAIYKEKAFVIKEELSPYLSAKLERLHYLERRGFMLDFIYSRKWIYRLFKTLFRIYNKLGLIKPAQ